MSELKKLLESTRDLTALELVIWWVADDGTEEALALAEKALDQLAALDAVRALAALPPEAK